jgi:hypothetical protein
VYRLRTVSSAVFAQHTLTPQTSRLEYVAVLQPSIVLWVVHPGALSIRVERANPTLARYLDPTFSQNLIHRQDEVDALVRGLAPQLQASSDAVLRHELERATHERFRRVPILSQLRSSFGPRMTRDLAERDDTSAFLQILATAREEVSRWNGRLILVLMPMYDEVVLHQQPDAIRHSRLAAEVEAHGIEVVDGGELFEGAADPAGLFTLRMESHPNRRGYELLAEGVLSELRTLDSSIHVSTR